MNKIYHLKVVFSQVILLWQRNLQIISTCFYWLKTLTLPGALNGFSFECWTKSRLNVHFTYWTFSKIIHHFNVECKFVWHRNQTTLHGQEADQMSFIEKWISKVTTKICIVCLSLMNLKINMTSHTFHTHILTHIQDLIGCYFHSNMKISR